MYVCVWGGGVLAEWPVIVSYVNLGITATRIAIECGHTCDEFERGIREVFLPFQ